MQDVPVIAIDGPSGSGKGTLAVHVANALGWHLLDSGALYRIIGVMCGRQGVEHEDETAVAALAQKLEIRFTEDKVRVGDLDLTDTIRTEEAGERASVVAQLPAVRAVVLTLQQQAAQPPGLVADGRDMGTVVFPQARLKIFLDASAQIRAERRYNQLKNKGLSVNLPALLAQIQERDARDRGREIAPLVPAADALVIDSTDMSIEDVLINVLQHAADRGFSAV